MPPISMIFVGDSQAGKTSIIKKWHKKNFDTKEIPTLGVEILNETIILNGKEEQIKLIDIAGQERLQTMLAPFFRTANLFAMTFAANCTPQQKHEQIKKWREKIAQYKQGSLDYQIIYLENKIDLVDARPLTATEQEQLNIDPNLYLTISAKSGVHIYELQKKVADFISQAAKSQQQKVTKAPEASSMDTLQNMFTGLFAPAKPPERQEPKTSGTTVVSATTTEAKNSTDNRGAPPPFFAAAPKQRSVVLHRVNQFETGNVGELIDKLTLDEARAVLQSIKTRLLEGTNHSDTNPYDVGWGGCSYNNNGQNLKLPTHVKQLVDKIDANTQQPKKLLYEIYADIQAAAKSDNSSRDPKTQNFYAKELPQFVHQTISTAKNPVRSFRKQ